MNLKYGYGSLQELRDFDNNRSMWAVKKEKFNVENNLDLVKNRLHLLQQEELRTQKKIEQLNKQTQKILNQKKTQLYESLNKQNNKEIIERELQERQRQNFMRRKMQEINIQRLRQNIEHYKKQGNIDLNLAKHCGHGIINEVKQQIKQENKQLADRIKQNLQLSQAKVQHFWQQKYQMYEDENKSRIMDQHYQKQQKEQNLLDLEQLEMNLLKKLENTQQKHQQAQDYLKNAYQLQIEDLKKQNLINSEDLYGQKRYSTTKQLEKLDNQMNSSLIHHQQNLFPIVNVKKEKKKNLVRNRVSNQDLSSKRSNFYDQYQLRREISRNQFNHFRFVQSNLTKQTLLAKFIKKSIYLTQEIEDIKQNLSRMIIAFHPNINRVVEYFEDDQYVIVVSQNIEGPDLMQAALNNNSMMSEQQCSRVIQQILSALLYLSNEKIIFQDLMPKNIIVTKEDFQEIKIVDFGLNDYVHRKKTQLSGLRCLYMAPEIINDKPHTYKSNLWSIGILMYTLLCGTPPFEGAIKQDIFNQIINNKINYNKFAFQNLSQEAQSFIKALLNPNPNMRPNFQQALQDPFFSQNKSFQNKIDNKTINKCFENLQQFNAGLQIQEAILAMFNNYLANQEENQKIAAAFQQLDIDKDGYLTVQELLAYPDLHQIIKGDDPYNEVLEIIQKLDLDGNGKIDYGEFIILTQDKSNLITWDNMKKIFKIFDQDGNGQVSLMEIKDVFHRQGYDDTLFVQLIKQADKSENQTLTLPEFELLMYPLVKQAQQRKQKL